MSETHMETVDGKIRKLRAYYNFKTVKFRIRNKVINLSQEPAAWEPFIRRGEYTGTSFEVHIWMILALLVPALVFATWLIDGMDVTPFRSRLNTESRRILAQATTEASVTRRHRHCLGVFHGLRR